MRSPPSSSRSSRRAPNTSRSSGATGHSRTPWPSRARSTLTVIPRRPASIDGLPAFVFTTDDGPSLQPPAEIAPSEAAVAAIQARGLMPLISFKDRDAIRLVTPTRDCGVSAPTWPESSHPFDGGRT